MSYYGNSVVHKNIALPNLHTQAVQQQKWRRLNRTAKLGTTGPWLTVLQSFQRDAKWRLFFCIAHFARKFLYLLSFSGNTLSRILYNLFF